MTDHLDCIALTNNKICLSISAHSLWFRASGNSLCCWITLPSLLLTYTYIRTTDPPIGMIIGKDTNQGEQHDKVGLYFPSLCFQAAFVQVLRQGVLWPLSRCVLHRLLVALTSCFNIFELGLPRPLPLVSTHISFDLYTLVVSDMFVFFLISAYVCFFSFNSSSFLVSSCLRCSSVT